MIRRTNLDWWVKDGMLALGILFTLAAQQSGPGSPAPDDPPIFVIGNETITASQVRGMLAVARQDALVNDGAHLKQWADQYLDQMVIATASIEKGYMDKPERRYNLALYTINVAANAFIEEQVTVSEDEVRAFYEANPSFFVRPEQRHAAHILVPTDSQAQEVIKALSEGLPWEEAVKKYSTDSSTKDKNGDLGWVRKGIISAALSEEIFSLGEGQFSSKPISTEYGYHIVKVFEIRPETRVTYDEAKGRIRDQLEMEKRRKYFQEQLPGIAKELREKKGARVNYEGLAAIASVMPSFEVPGIVAEMDRISRGQPRPQRPVRGEKRKAAPAPSPALP